MKKKLLVLLLAVLMVSVCALTLAACGEHECQDPFPTCGKCTTECEDEACADKCQGHAVLSLTKDNLFAGLSGTSYATYNGDHTVSGYTVNTQNVLGNSNNNYAVLQFRKAADGSGTLQVTGTFSKVVFVIESSYEYANNISVYAGETKLSTDNVATVDTGNQTSGGFAIKLYTVTVAISGTGSQVIKLINETSNAVYLTSVDYYA